MKLCKDCGHDIDADHDFRCDTRHPSVDYSVSLPPEAGQLGQSAEEHERARIKALPPGANAQPTDQALIKRQEMALQIHALVAPVVKEMMRDVQGALDGIRRDIEENTRALKLADVPLEQVAASHERAAASFETLRKEIAEGGLDKLEKVLDVSGLTEAATRGERRLEAAVLRLETKIDGTVAAHAADMVQVLHLLERLHSRELSDAKRRASKATKPRKRNHD